VTLAADNLAGEEVGDVRADLHDLAHELMADNHGNRDRAGRPVVPVEDVEIGAADRGLSDPYQHIVDADGGDRHVLEPQPGFSVLLDESFQRGLLPLW
jgi:hypothetical protein